MSNDTKICGTCKRSLPIEDFSPKGAGQRHAHCRTCRAASARQRITVGAEQRTYSPHSPYSFFVDSYRSQKHADPAAQQRLERHAQEARAITTGGGGAGFMPPEYLAEEWISVARSGRPFADLCNLIPLVESGVQFSIPQFTTGTAVGVQNPENSSVTSQDTASSQLTANVVEISGALDMSQQVFQRISPGVDTVIFGDLMDAYNEKLDSQLINGSGSSGQHLGIRNVSGVISQTYTSGSPDAQTCVTNILQAASAVATNRKKWPTHVVLHPRRYAWLMASSAVATLFEHEESGLAKMEFILDPNVGTTYGASTNQDEIYICYPHDFLLAESQAFLKMQDVGSGTLTVRTQIHTNSLFFTRRAKSVAIVSGTGLTAPAGY